MIQARTTLLFVLFSVLALCFACSSEDEEPIGDDMLVDDKGAILQTESGVTLTIPAGALEQAVTFSIVETTPPDSLESAGRFFRIGPEETELLKPVTVELPLDLENLSASKQSKIALHFSFDSENFTALTGELDLQNELVRARSEQLGVFGPAISSNDTPAPAELETAEELDFGLLSVDEQAQQTLQISNQGEAPLTISSAEITTNSTPFELPMPPSNVQIEAEAVYDLTVTFQAAQSGVYEAELLVNSDDAENPAWPVTLRATVSGGGEATVSPDRLDFGSVNIGENHTLDIELQNSASQGSLTLYEVELESGPFALEALSLPLTLNAGDSETLTVSFAPSVSGSAQADLLLKVDDASRPEVEIELLGVGVATDGDSDDAIDGDLDE